MASTGRAGRLPALPLSLAAIASKLTVLDNHSVQTVSLSLHVMSVMLRAFLPRCQSPDPQGQFLLRAWRNWPAWGLVALGCAVAKPPASTPPPPVGATKAVTSDERPRLAPALLAKEKSLWIDRDPLPWLALLEPRTRIVAGRAASVDGFDVTFDSRGYATLLSAQLGGPTYGIPLEWISHERVEETTEGNSTTVEMTRVLHYGPCEEWVRERYVFLRDGDAVYLATLRYWPLSMSGIGMRNGQTRFDAQGLKTLDLATERLYGDPRDKAKAYYAALRYREAAAVYHDIVATSDDGKDWLEFGWSAAFAGQLDVAGQAFEEARKRDQTLPTPKWDVGP